MSGAMGDSQEVGIRRPLLASGKMFAVELRDDYAIWIARQLAGKSLERPLDNKSKHGR